MSHSRGKAMALAMLANEALTGAVMRLCWCVDIDRDVGPPAPMGFLCGVCAKCGGVTNPATGRCTVDLCGGPPCGSNVVSTPSGTVCGKGHGAAPWYQPPNDGRGGKWGALLTRLLGALRDPPPDPGRLARCRFAVVVREVYPTAGPTVITVGVSYFCDPSYLTRGPPPAGAWRAWPLPPLRVGTNEEWSPQYDDDQRVDRLPLPDSFWMDGIPF